MIESFKAPGINVKVRRDMLIYDGAPSVQPDLHYKKLKGISLPTSKAWRGINESTYLEPVILHVPLGEYLINPLKNAISSVGRKFRK